MTIRYSSDTCGCIVDLEHGTLMYVDWVQKCTGHTDKNGQDLVDAIKIQCLKFQISKEDQKDKTKINENVIAKLKEKRRILDLGPVSKNSKAIRITPN